MVAIERFSHGASDDDSMDRGDHADLHCPLRVARVERATRLVSCGGYCFGGVRRVAHRQQRRSQLVDDWQIWNGGRLLDHDQRGQLGGVLGVIARWTQRSSGGAHDVLRDDARLDFSLDPVRRRIGLQRIESTHIVRLDRSHISWSVLFGHRLYFLV